MWSLCPTAWPTVLVSLSPLYYVLPGVVPSPSVHAGESFVSLGTIRIVPKSSEGVGNAPGDLVLVGFCLRPVLLLIYSSLLHGGAERRGVVSATLPPIGSQTPSTMDWEQSAGERHRQGKETWEGWFQGRPLVVLFLLRRLQLVSFQALALRILVRFRSVVTLRE